MISEIEMEIAVDRSEMIQELHDRNCKVIFRKVDGTERTMICTSVSYTHLTLPTILLV